MPLQRAVCGAEPSLRGLQPREGSARPEVVLLAWPMPARNVLAPWGSLFLAGGALAQTVEAAEIDASIRPAPVGEQEFAQSDRAVAGLGLTPTVATALSPAVGIRLGFRGGGTDGALLTLDASRLQDAGVSEWQVLGSAGWLWARDLGSARFWVGASAGAGFVMQTKPGHSALASGVVAAGPSLGVDARLHGSFGIWAEAQAFGLLYRRDSEAVASLAPSAWLGASLAL
jgi:hypothetical protein